MKYSYLIAFFLIFASLGLLFIPTPSADPSIIISDYELIPSTLMPGDKGILTLTITNAETASTTTETYDTELSIVKVNGATIDEIRIIPAYDDSKQIKSLARYTSVAYLTASASINIAFEIVADENISEGSYFPKVKIDVEENEYMDLLYPFLVKISNSTVDLLAANIPSKMSIGGSTDVTLTVVNNRDDDVGKVTITPREISDIEFYPKNIFIGDLDADSHQNVSFSIEPSETGLKNLTFEVSYYNGDNQHNNTLEVSTEIIETYDVAPVLYYVPSSISKGETSRIRLEIYNSKGESISGVIVTPITDVKISPSQYFIGSMDTDDVFSASFDVYTDDLVIGNDYSVNFKVTYKQGNNYYDSPILTSSFKVVEPTIKDTGFTTIVLVVIIILVLVISFIFIIRRKRRISR